MSSPKPNPSDDDVSSQRLSDLAFLAAHGVDPLDVAEDDTPPKRPQAAPTTTPTDQQPMPVPVTSEQPDGEGSVVSLADPALLDPEILNIELYSPDRPSPSFLKRHGVDPFDVAEDDSEDWRRAAKKVKADGGVPVAVMDVIEEVEEKAEVEEVKVEVEEEEELKVEEEKGQGDDEMGDGYVQGADGGDEKSGGGCDEEDIRYLLYHRYHWEDEEENDEEDGEGEEEEEEEEDEEEEEEEAEVPEKLGNPYDLDHWEPMDDYTRSVRREFVRTDDEAHRPMGAPPYATWFGEERDEAEYFHMIREDMSAYYCGRKPPFARCPICLDAQLSLRFVPIYRPREAEDREDLPDLVAGAVLKCGHMVCRPCWERRVRQHIEDVDPVLLEQERRYPPITCPVCREELCHPGCGCHIPAYRMPRSLDDPEVSQAYRSHWGWYYSYVDDGWMADVPPTLNDDTFRGEDKIPDKCDRCSRDPTRAARVRARPPLAYQVGDLTEGYDE
jgi:hypothetical protein